MFDSLDQIFSKVPEHFLADNAEGVEARIQFDFEG